MSLDPSKASRFGGSKVRTGCLTCVKRHLKCGEELPSCKRCLKAGRICRQRSSASSGGANDLRIVHYISKPASNPSAFPFQDNVELRSLEFFRLRTAPEIAGVHNPELWSYHVLQIAVADRAIWNAAVALGALHERFESSGSMSVDLAALEYPLSQYGKAISQLCASIKESTCASRETPLLACALFCAFESMAYHLHSALSHVGAGLKVLASEFKSKDDRRPSPNSPLALLFPLFTRLDTQRLELGDSSFPSEQPLGVMAYKDPKAIASFDLARHCFDNVINKLLHHIKHIHRDDIYWSFAIKDSTADESSDLDEAIQTYLHWTTSLDQLTCSMQSEKDIPSALLLQVWRLLVNIMLRGDLKEGEMAFDRFHPDFELMTLMIEEFICWSAHHSGPPQFLLMAPSPGPLDEKLPPTLRERHRAFTGQGTQRSGFMGVHYPAKHAANILTESTAAQVTAEQLLLRSRAGRSIAPGFVHEMPVSGTDSVIKPTFTYSHGIIYPLYVTISRCRDPKIRRKAWMLMYRCNRREGLWDSVLAARLGQRIIQIEETHALQSLGYALADPAILPITSSAQIPNWCRVRMLRPTFLPHRRSIERYYFGWPGTFEDATGIEEVWIEEPMEW